MPTLILKTEGMSAYGLQTFDVQRRVNNFPTRSAILGMLGAALGIRRDNHEALYLLSNKLKIAVQVNNVGQKIMDYHTVQRFRSPAGKIKKGTKPTYREYWCDSEHSFAITSTEGVINDLLEAVKKPRFTLFQGRKSCPLTRPLLDKVGSDDNPVQALVDHSGNGQIYSDVNGPNNIATLQLRDMTTKHVRKYATRKVYLCAKEA